MITVKSDLLRRFCLGLLALFAFGLAAGQPVCKKNSPAASTLSGLREAMTQGRFIAYQPTSLQVLNGRPTRADPQSIREDLKALRPRFDSLITYGAGNGAEAIASIAASLGYRAVIMGLYDPFDRAELDAAIAAAQANPKIVVGFSLGNEMYFGRRRSFIELASLMQSVRLRVPNIPLSTTEPFHLFYEPGATPVMQQMDFLLANVHPVFQPWFRGAPDSNAAQFVVNVVNKLAEIYCGPILVKETGVPTAPADMGFNAARQASFYRELLQQFPPSNARAFAYFSAFDAPWRVNDIHPVPGAHPEEAFWGLYDERRQPKAVVAQIPLLPAKR